MFCPSCQCEYIPGVTQCAECDVPLVDALVPSSATPAEDSDIVTIWSGNDRGELVAVKEALKKAQIPFMSPESTGYFIVPSMQPKLEIGVSTADRDRAVKALVEIEKWDDPEELTAQEREELALPESDAIDDDEDTTLPDAWDDEQPATEVWSGEANDFADTLAACLRENGILSRKLDDAAGRWCLMVRCEQEARAKEIVREVVEASPPR